MTVATLLLTCLIFLIVGWNGPSYYVTALSIGGIVCIAASNGGTTSQDLKTGFLVGSTPRYQQIAILVGAFASALILGPILLQLNNTSTVFVPQTTFAAVKNPPQVDSSVLSALPVYSEATKAQTVAATGYSKPKQVARQSPVWIRASTWSMTREKLLSR